MLGKSILLFLIIAIGVSACRKKKDPQEENLSSVTTPVNTPVQNGLPIAPNKIDGYFFSRYTYNLSYSLMDMYAAFGSSSRALMLDYSYRTKQFPSAQCQSTSPDTKIASAYFAYYVSPLHIDTSQGCICYKQQFNVYDTLPTPQIVPSWAFSGDSNLPSFTTTIPRGFPQINYNTTFNNNISKSSGVTFSVINKFTNYDSLYIIISQGFSNICAKRCGKDSLIIIPGSAFDSFSVTTSPANGTQPTAMFVLINYSNQIIQDKKFVFELTGLLNWNNFQIVP